MSSTNTNQRSYEPKAIDKAVLEYSEKEHKFCTLNHSPDQSGIIDTSQISHRIEDISSENGIITGTLRLLDTPMGKALRTMLDGGTNIRLVTEGTGNLGENNVVENYHLTNLFFSDTPAVPTTIHKVANTPLLDPNLFIIDFTKE